MVMIVEQLVEWMSGKGNRNTRGRNLPQCRSVMEAVRSSEMSIVTRATRRHIQEEDDILQIYFRVIPKSFIISIFVYSGHFLL
jgi:hypothetical protein